jgi:hypothetical protein
MNEILIIMSDFKKFLKPRFSETTRIKKELELIEKEVSTCLASKMAGDMKDLQFRTLNLYNEMFD